jgi:ADP-heptose:LPS heptosyltransferase
MVILSRLKNLFVLALASVRFIFKGRADKKIIPKKILIIQTAKMGDMVCTTPMFRAVKEKYPVAKLYVMGNALNQELLAGNPNVDNYIICDKNFNFRDILSRIKKEKFDFACVVAPNFLLLAIAYLASIPCIAAPVIKNGFSPYETRPYKLLRNFVIRVSHHIGSYTPLEYLRLLETVGVKSGNTQKQLFFSEGASEAIKKFFANNKISPDKNFIVCLVPSVGSKIRLWSPDRFAKITDYLYQKYGAKIIVLGGQGDIKEVEAVLDRLDKNTQVINAVNIFNIDQLKALIAKSNLFVGVETGPTFIAEAFNVPIIDIVGPLDDREQSPRGQYFKTVKLENRKEPALHIMNARFYDQKEAREQIDGITVPMVINALDDLIESLPNLSVRDNLF